MLKLSPAEAKMLAGYIQSIHEIDLIRDNMGMAHYYGNPKLVLGGHPARCEVPFDDKLVGPLIIQRALDTQRQALEFRCNELGVDVPDLIAPMNLLRGIPLERGIETLRGRGLLTDDEYQQVLVLNDGDTQPDYSEWSQPELVRLAHAKGLVSPLGGRRLPGKPELLGMLDKHYAGRKAAHGT